MIKIKGDFEKAKKEMINDKNNAVSHIFENAKNNSGILEKSVFTIKDVFANFCAKTQASSFILKDFHANYNATVIQKLLDAGASPVAKVNCDELALGGEGIYSHWGIIANPLNLKRKVGGSSSGSAATLTENISFALASDTGDSVRLPASFIGKVGFKPTYGAVSRFGMFAYASSLDTVAWFAHNVNDIIQVAQAVYGKDEKDFTSKNVEIKNIKLTKPQKIGYLNIKGQHLLNKEIEDSYFNLVNKLAKEVTMEKIEPNAELLTAIKPVYDIISYSEASSNLSNLNGIAFGQRQKGENWEEIMTNTRSKGFGKMVQRRLILGSYFLEKDNQEKLFLRAQKIRRLIKNYLDDLHSQYDIVIYPASASIAPLFDDKSKYGYMDYILTGSNLAGNPSITMKLEESKIEKMPFNLAIDAKSNNDKKLLEYALWIEQFINKGENNE
nr:amidase family protein [Mesomycoplasma lagogenitalium]